MAIPALVALAAKLLPFATAVPEVLRAFGGAKQANAAEKIVGVAKVITGQDDAETAVASIVANPQLQLDFQRMLSNERLEFARLEVEDRKDARGRDVEVRKLTGGRNRRADVMLVSAFLAVIAIAALLALGKVDGATAVGGFLMTIGGMFARNIGTAFDFEFGSSRSSRDKDELLAKARG